MSQAQTPPILLVHGAWHGKWCYEKYFVEYLADQGLDVYAIDLPYHGEKFTSTRDLRWRSMTHYVDAVADYAEQLDSPPILVGHSLGGAVVQKYLEKHKAPAAILLASMPPSGVWRVTLNMLRHHPWRFLKVNLKLSLHPLVDTAKLAQQHFFSADMANSDIQSYFEQLHDESYRAFLDMLFLNLPKPKRVSTPILVLGGENDTIFSVKEVEATAKAYNTEAIIFPNMAHDMMLEKGWQGVADKIANWVKTIS